MAEHTPGKKIKNWFADLGKDRKRSKDRKRQKRRRDKDSEPLGFWGWFLLIIAGLFVWRIWLKPALTGEAASGLLGWDRIDWATGGFTSGDVPFWQRVVDPAGFFREGGFFK